MRRPFDGYPFFDFRTVGPSTHRAEIVVVVGHAGTPQSLRWSCAINRSTMLRLRPDDARARENLQLARESLR